ncbi:hypothetical protein ACSFA3_09085 [Variovorax sp. RHLX14]|uniref:hypothetical protein n=1 Tax=Variovorax sp. RHLX14 TaxID=1259731 RepID=UPI003F471098
MEVRRKGAIAARQRGAAALVLAAMMVIFTGTLVATYYLGSRSASSIARFEQVESLRWAQESITGFAAANGRLPCPASSPDGTENCTSGFAKGWLPTAAIEQFGSTPGARGRMPLRYLAYRGVGAGSDPDLATLDDAYQPALAATVAAPAAYPSLISSVDLCGKLRAAALPHGSSRWQTGGPPTGATARPARANVPVTNSGGSIMNVAYGLAASPIGTAKSDSGLNADIAPQLESPYRAVDNAYRDVVRVVDFAALSDALSCSAVMASLDTLSTAATWTAAAVGAREGAIKGSQALIDIESVAVPSAAVGVVSAQLDVKNAIAKAVESVATVAQNFPGLPDPVSVVAVASGNAGIVTSAETLRLAEIDRIRAVAGAMTEAGYMLAYIAAKKTAEDSYVWNGSASILAIADRQGVSP